MVSTEDFESSSLGSSPSIPANLRKRYRVSHKARVEHKYEKYLFFFSRCVKTTIYYQIILIDYKEGTEKVVAETTNLLAARSLYDRETAWYKHEMF